VSAVSAMKQLPPFYHAVCRALLRHERRVQRLGGYVESRAHDDAKAQVCVVLFLAFQTPKLTRTLFLQATLHRVLRHLVLHRQRLAAIEHALARDRAAAAAAERKLGQALSVQPTIDMSYKQTKLQQHKLASTIDNFAPQVQHLSAAAALALVHKIYSLVCLELLTRLLRRVRSTLQHSLLLPLLRMSQKVT